MKLKYILLMIGLPILVGCHKVTVDFYYFPAEPAAGEIVTFTNTTENGEEYEWDFGDNIHSNSTSPNHAYRKAGTYIATVTETKTRRSYSRAITVHDTMPTFKADSATIYYYQPATFRAKIYNPFKHVLRYEWAIDPSCTILQSGSLTEDTICVLFTRLHEPVTLSLTIYDQETPHVISQTISVADVPARALLMRSGETAYRQRMYGMYLEEASVAAYAEAKTLLDQTQDTIATYGDMIFRLSELNIDGHTPEGFLLDTVARKIYFRDHGLYVANVNKSNVVCLCADAVNATCLDKQSSRLFYATAQGVYSLPLIHQVNNVNTYTPTLINTLPSVSQITLDPVLR